MEVNQQLLGKSCKGFGEIAPILHDQLEHSVNAKDYRSAKRLSVINQRFAESMEALVAVYDSLTEQALSPIKRSSYGKTTRQKEYWLPVLEVLLDLGGAGPKREVLPLVKSKMDGVLNGFDLQMPNDSPNSGERWVNILNKAHGLLRREGLVKKDSPRGIWEITKEGEDYLRERGAQSRAPL